MATDVSLRASGTGFKTLVGQVNRLGKSLTGVGKMGAVAGQRLRTGFSRLRGDLTSVQGIATGLGVALGGKQILDFNASLGELQATTRRSTDSMKGLKSEILDNAAQTGQSKESILEFVSAVQDVKGTTEEAQSQLKNMTAVLRGTGAAGFDVGNVFARLLTKGFDASQATEQIGKIIAATQSGSINFKDLSKQVPVLLGAFEGAGIKGARAIEQINIAMQTVGTQLDPARASTAIQTLIGDLKISKAEINAIAGAKLIDKEGNIKDIDEIAGRLFKKLGPGAVGKLVEKRLITREGGRALQAFAGSINPQTGQLVGTGALVKAASKRGGAEDIKAQLDKRNKGIDKAGSDLTKTLRTVEKYFQQFGGSILDAANENKAIVGTIAGIGFAGLGINKLGAGRGRDPLTGRFMRVGGLKRLLGFGAAKAAGINQVFVVNQIDPADIGSSVSGQIGGKLGSLTGIAGKAGVATGVFAAAYQLGTIVDEWTGASDRIADTLLGLGPGPDKAANDQVAGMLAIEDQARRLAALRASGVTSFGKAGEMKALTPENILANLKAAAERQGVSEQAFAKMLPVLQQIANNTKSGQVIVKDRPLGIDAPSVQGSRQGS